MNTGKSAQPLHQKWNENMNSGTRVSVGKFKRNHLPTRGINFKPRFPEREPTSEEVSWVAGFMEGEGSFNSSGRSFEIGAYQSNIEPLEKLKSIMGGEIYKTKARNGRNVNSKESYAWRASGRVAIFVCLHIYEHLSEKRKRAIENRLQKLAKRKYEPS